MSNPAAPALVLPSLDPTFGAIFVGILVATALEGVLTLQCYIYYSNFKEDRAFLKGLVGVVWFLDTLHLAIVAAMQYAYVITNFDDFTFLAAATWQFDVSVILTSTVAFLIQSYFMWRTWVLTKNYPLALTIFILALLSLGFGIACGAETFILKDFKRFVVFSWGVSTWLGASAACDLVVAGSLCWTLWHSKTGFKPTDTLLDRLIVWTLNTGMLTSVVAVIDLICFATMNNLVHFAFNVTLAKLYANMFVATLNQRLRARSRSNTGMEFDSETEGGNGKRTTRRFKPITFAGNNRPDMSVQITRTKEMDGDAPGTPMTPVDHLKKLREGEHVDTQKVDLGSESQYDGQSDHSKQNGSPV